MKESPIYEYLVTCEKIKRGFINYISGNSVVRIGRPPSGILFLLRSWWPHKHPKSKSISGESGDIRPYLIADSERLGFPFKAKAMQRFDNPTTIQRCTVVKSSVLGQCAMALFNRFKLLVVGNWKFQS